MSIRKLGWWCLSLMLLACPGPAPLGPCGGETCSAEQRCDPSSLHCVVDDPPVVSVVAPTALVTSATFVVTGKITDDVGVSAAEWKLGNGAVTPLTLAADGSFSITIDAPLLDSQSVTITVKASDAHAGTSVDKQVLIDRMAPTLRLVRPNPTAVITTPTVEISVEATDGSGAISALAIGGTAVPSPRSGAEAVAMLTIPTTLVGDVFSFEVVATDPGGNQTAQMMGVTVDRAGPVITFVSPAVGQYITGASFTVELDATDLSEVQSILVSAEGPAFTAVDQGSGRWSASVLTSVEEQDRVITVEATDTLGNVTVASRMVRIDRIAPSIGVTIPSANSLQTLAFAPVAVTTSADTEQVSASVANAMVTLTGGPTSWIAQQLALPSLDSVNASIHVVARDVAGNTASLDHPILIDNVAPQVVITAPAMNTLHRTNIAISANIAGAVDTVTATLEGATLPLTGGPGTWTGTFVVPQHDYAPSTLRVTARDANGNTSFDEVVIAVDTVAPVVAFTAPSAGQKFNASAFASSPNVTSAWTVTDADPQAATTTVNGAASTAASLARPTNATDNPASYTTTVIAADRAGNSTTSSVSYSVDRVVPTITAWIPATGVRMLELTRTDILFSEPVFGATPATPALSVLSSPQTNTPLWDSNHSLFQMSLVALRGLVVDVGLTAGMADSHGNPVAAPAARKFHFATSIPSGSLLASNVSTFAATADQDGVLRVSYLTTAGVWRYAGDLAPGLFDTVSFPQLGTKVTANSWSTINPTSLVATLQWSSSIFNAGAAAGSQYTHSLDGTNAFASHAIGATVTVPTLAREPANAPYAIVVGNTYTRGTFTRTFSTIADMVTAQSADSWAVASHSGTQVRWSRYRCNRDAQIFPGPATYTCAGTEYGGSTAPLVPDFLEAAMTRSGNCLVVNLRAPQGASTWSGGWFQPLENCDGALGVSPPASCDPNTNLPIVAGYFRQRIAPFSANGEDTILFAFPAGTANPNEYRLEKMLPGVCAYSTTYSTLFSVPNVREFQPVQIGTKPAFIYVNTSNELRVHIP